jgi:head-tail adaptor
MPAIWRANKEGKKMTSFVIAAETVEQTTRTWYAVSGHDSGTGRDINGEYAICNDGRVLDCDGYPMNDSDRETIAVRNLIN